MGKEDEAGIKITIEEKKGSARMGHYWFKETEKARNFRIFKMIVGIFSFYLSLTVLGIGAILFAIFFPDSGLFHALVVIFGLCLASYVPFVALYLRFRRAKHIEFYSKGVMAELLLGGDVFIPYREFVRLEELKINDVGKVYRLVPASGDIMRKNILLPKKAEGAAEYAEKIKDALELSRE